MNEMPLVSVIIPIYKVEPYLRACVDSVLAQTYRNIEIILVDDGSPDGCPAICDEYATKDNRVRVIHKENGGLSDARNTGVDVAKGEWLCFVDSDDVVHTHMISLLIQQVLNNKDCKVCCCSYSEIAENEVPIFSDIPNSSVRFEQLNLEKYMYVPIWMTAWGKLYSKDLFLNIKFPEDRLHEDEFTTYKVLYNVEKIIYLASPLYFYRQRKSSIMGCLTKQNATDAFDALVERFLFFKSKREVKLARKVFIDISIFYVGLFQKRFKNTDTLDTKRRIKIFFKRQDFKMINVNEKIKLFVRLSFPNLLALRADLINNK